MSSRKWFRSVYIMIAAGIILAVCCLFFAIFNPSSKKIDILNLVFLSLQALFGLIIIIASERITHKFFHLFMGQIFLSWSIISILLAVAIPFTTKEFWPVYGILAGIALCVSGHLKYGSIKFGYLIPSVTLIGMGMWYLLFSMGIIRLSFRYVVMTLGPLFLISIALLLIIYYFVQQKHKELVFSDEEIGVFSDEEASFKFDSDEE